MRELQERQSAEMAVHQILSSAKCGGSLPSHLAASINSSLGGVLVEANAGRL